MKYVGFGLLLVSVIVFKLYKGPNPHIEYLGVGCLILGLVVAITFQ